MQINVIQNEVGGITNWWWPEIDRQTFSIIARDWVNTHSSTISRVMKEQNKKCRGVVQAGGNCGMYPRLLANMFEWVYTFEPDPLNFTALALNTAQSNIFKAQMALGDKPTRVKMIHRTMANVGMHMVKESEEGSIPQIDLDSLKLDNIDLLWLDVEEYEIHALMGAERTIRHNSPVIMCENPTDEVVEYMGELSYSKVGMSGMDGIFVNNK